MARDRFIDPAGIRATYNWTVNHDAEDSQGKTRNISRTAPTGSVGLVKQQGDDGPLILKFSGRILDREQYQQFWAWYELSRTRTIYFYDYDDQGYEVQITSFQPKRVRKAMSPGRDASMAFHTYDYTLELEVYRVIQGDLLGVSP
jgi:hypothetical protein